VLSRVWGLGTNGGVKIVRLSLTIGLTYAACET